MAFKPLIGVTACVKQIGLHPYHISGDKYLRAVSVAALGLPVVIPSLGELTEIEDLLAQLDGLLLTGSPSNVEPFHYQGPASAPGTDHDPAGMPRPFLYCVQRLPPACRYWASAAAFRK